MKRFTGLLREDLKRKLGMIAAAWYSMGMLCLVFSMKTTVPTGEVRSLYVGPGNTSFFAVMVLFGILMGAGAFRFLRSEPECCFACRNEYQNIGPGNQRQRLYCLRP